MVILGKTVSEKSSKIIADIEQRLKMPVKYVFTDPEKTRSYGYCDWTQPDAYYVACQEQLLSCARKKDINIPFETNLLHELFHLCQIEEGFPYTNTKAIGETLPDMDFHNKMGSQISSSILDLNVDFRLKEHGYFSEYFYGQRVIHAEKHIRKHPDFSDPVQFVYTAMALLCLNLSFTQERMEPLLCLYNEKSPELINCVHTLSAEVSMIGYNSPESAFRSLVLVFNAFNIFATHSIRFRGKEYSDFASVQQDFPDIRVLF